MKNASEHLVDQLLVMDAQDGDRRAMAKLVERWQKRLWRHAYRLTGDVQAAWDVTQQTWLGVIKGIRKLHDPAKFRPWAYRITTNKAMDFLKSRPLTGPLPERPIEDRRAAGRGKSALGELLDKLNPAKRAVLALYYLEELTVTEIGAVLKIPAGTVKSRLFIARNELKRLWQKDIE